MQLTTRSLKHRAPFAVALFLVALGTTRSNAVFAAPENTAGAKEAYERGLAAHRRGDHKRAAEEFARADALSPNVTALQAALDAAIEADDAALGSELLERGKRAPPSPALASSITAAHLKFSGRVGRVRVLCPKGSSCTARLGERAVDIGKVVAARTGQQPLAATVDGQARTTNVEIAADQLVEVALTKGAAPTVSRGAATASIGAAAEPERAAASWAQDGPRRHGLSPIFFYVGVGLTAVVGGATTYFAIDASNEHAAFEDAGCLRADFPPCRGLKSDGEASQRAANIGLVLTAITGAATAAVGALLTDWRGPIVALRPGGGEAAWRVTF